MRPTIQYYEFLLTCLRQLKQMVEAENVPAALHPKSQEITKELLSAIEDYIAIIDNELTKIKFWDWVLSNGWARKWYYLFPDNKNWEDEEEEDE